MATPPTRVLGVTPAVGWASTATPKTSPTFDVQAGDLIVLQAFSEDGRLPLAAPTWTGTGVWTLRQSIVINDYCTAYLYTCAVTATQTGRTISMARSGTGNSQWSFIASVWRNHGGLGVTGKANASGAPSLALVTSANSAVIVGNSDWTASSGTRTWRTVNGAPMTETSFGGTAGSTYMCYTGYTPDSGAAGTITLGMTAPSGQKYSIMGAEVLGTAGSTPNTGTAASTITRTTTATGKETPIGSTASTITRTATAAGKRDPQGSAATILARTTSAQGASPNAGTTSSIVTRTGSAEGKRMPVGSASSTITHTGNASGIAPVVGGHSGTATTTVTRTTTASGKQDPIGSSATTVTRTTAADGKRNPVGSIATTVTRTTQASGVAPLVDTNSGSAVTSISWTTVATGKRNPIGEATTTVARTGNATGTTPTVDTNSGTITTIIKWTTNAAGARNPIGTTATTIARTGTAEGTTIRSGIIASSIAWITTAHGSNTLKLIDINPVGTVGNTQWAATATPAWTVDIEAVTNRWQGEHMATTLQRETEEWLPIPVKHQGVPIIASVKLAILPTGTRPTAEFSEFTDATIVEGATGIMVTDLPPGDYEIWARVTTALERPVIRCGALRIA